MIPLLSVLQIQYPNMVIGLFGQIQLADHNDGNGPFIQTWNVPTNVISLSLNVTGQPTPEQLVAWQTDPVTLQAYTYMQNAIVNQPIKAQLVAIDMKTIRSLRENDTAMLTQFTTQASALRSQLLPES